LSFNRHFYYKVLTLSPFEKRSKMTVGQEKALPMNEKKDIIEIDEKLIEAFHLMYDHFPEPATLVHKSRRVMAVNPACKIIGREPGMICARQGSAAAHKGCLAGEAVKSHQAKFRKIIIEAPDRRSITAFWLPVDGHPDFYIHFAVGATMDY